MVLITSVAIVSILVGANKIDQIEAQSAETLKAAQVQLEPIPASESAEPILLAQASTPQKEASPSAEKSEEPAKAPAKPEVAEKEEPTTAATIIRKFEEQKAEALEEYLSANPGAPDAAMASDALLVSYRRTGELEKMLPLAESKYEAVRGVDIESQLGLLSLLVDLYVAQGQKEKAEKLIGEAPQDLGIHAQNPQVRSFMMQMQMQLMAPSRGETMDISFVSMGGQQVDTMDMDGKVVLVNFWATWCPPCVEEIPTIKAAYDKWKGKGFEVVGISLDDDRDALESFLSENNVEWPQHFDGGGRENEFFTKFKLFQTPSSFLLKDGVIVATNLRGDALEKVLNIQLGELN